MKGKKYGKTGIIGGEKLAEGWIFKKQSITAESELQQYYIYILQASLNA